MFFIRTGLSLLAMASSSVTVKGPELKEAEGVARPCPASCGATISGRDPHPLCTACMGAKHAQASLVDPQVCAHCSAMSEKTLERRLRVAVAKAGSQDPNLAAPATRATTDHRPRASCSWASQVDLSEVQDGRDLPPLFGDEEFTELGGQCEDADGDAGSDILELDDMEEGEDESTFPTQPSRPPSSTGAASPVDNGLYEVCKRAAGKLNIPWPAAQDMEGKERDIYDGKRLPPAQPPAKQLLPAVPACMREMNRFWTSPYRSKQTTQGYSKLEVHGMEGLGLAEPPAVEPSVAYHLHPNRSSVSAASNISLPSKSERTTAGIYQRIYKYAAQSVCSLNAVTLLAAYQAEILEEMGQQLDSGAPNPVLWDEICIVNDLLLRSSRGAVQGSGRVMGLAVAGERALWLNLSGLGDTQKAEVMDAPYDPAKGLFGPALEKMRETSTLRKQEGEAFNLCLPRKQEPRPTSRTGFAAAAAAARGRQSDTRQAYKPPAGRGEQQPRAAGNKPWGKQSFAAAAAKRRSPHPGDNKKKRAT